MSMILNELNKMAFWIAPLFYKLLSMSLTACCIGLVVLLLRKFADKKIAPAWKYALWALMLVALILPYRPQSETAVLPTTNTVFQLKTCNPAVPFVPQQR